MLAVHRELHTPASRSRCTFPLACMQTRRAGQAVTQGRGLRDILDWLSWWIEKAGFWSECGRAFTSLLRISLAGGV